MIAAAIFSTMQGFRLRVSGLKSLGVGAPGSSTKSYPLIRGGLAVRNIVDCFKWYASLVKGFLEAQSRDPLSSKKIN